ncbi:serine/threonine-protein kinase [Nocardia sp. NBC_01329]|uniref:serine/threonine-protein kinase n=1 Tax=Nocardia sp. NBC_01329 TaxID=2903594 RepID=UPI002E10E492|nr:protein kinase [Nocardia sp. NBC_01329]
MEGTEFGRYRLLDPLGAGAMGEVHRAYDTGTERMVAVKVLSKEYAQDKTYRQRFQREAQLVARLHEPHIVPIHDFGEIDGRLFLEMRLVEAPDLATLLADSGPLVPAEAVAVITQIAAALDAAHASGVVHRDVKPSNILVTPDNFAYLIDFGIARSGGDTTLTRAGTMIGTLAYMAPERLTLDRIDGRSDVYSLACVLYECLAGTKPYLGDSVERQIAAHLTDRPPLPSVVGVPPAFDAVIAAGMAKDPDDRYESAGELAAAARQALLPVESPQSVAPLADFRSAHAYPGDFPPPDTSPDGPRSAATPPDGPGSAATPPDGPGSAATPPDGPGSAATPPDGPGSAATPPDGPGSAATPPDGPGSAATPPADMPPADTPPSSNRPVAPRLAVTVPAKPAGFRFKTAAAVAALVIAGVSVSALALTREGSTVVTDAPETTAPPAVSVTSAPGTPAAGIAPAPPPRLHEERPMPSATHSVPPVPPVAPGNVVPENTVTADVPTPPASDPVDEPRPAPPLPTTSVATPPTTTVAPTTSETTPTTTTDPGSSTPSATSSSSTATTAPPDTTGTGEQSASAVGTATTEQADSRGSAIATSSAHVPSSDPIASATSDTPDSGRHPTSTRTPGTSSAPESPGPSPRSDTDSR